jgi:hypothetical protein
MKIILWVVIVAVLVFFFGTTVLYFLAGIFDGISWVLKAIAHLIDGVSWIEKIFKGGLQ